MFSTLSADYQHVIKYITFYLTYVVLLLYVYTMKAKLNHTNMKKLFTREAWLGHVIVIIDLLIIFTYTHLKS